MMDDDKIPKPDYKEKVVWLSDDELADLKKAIEDEMVKRINQKREDALVEVGL